jgi:hypothetical protein
MAVEVSARNGALRPSAPQLLFAPDNDSQLAGQYFDVAPDGRFLMVRGSSGTAITIVVNLFEELKAMGREAEGP